MSTDQITLVYFAQHCQTAGLPVADPASRYGEDWRDSHDLMVLEGTEVEHVAWARETLARKPWCGPYYNRVARHVLAHFGEPDSPAAPEADPVQAEWDGERYVATSPGGQVWYSADGDNWTDETGEQVISEVFYESTIAFAGGPRAGQRVC